MRSRIFFFLAVVVCALGAWAAGRSLTGAAQGQRGTAAAATDSTMPEIAFEHSERSSALARLKPADFRAALEEIPKDADELRQLAALWRLAERLAIEDFPTALEAIRNLKEKKVWPLGALLTAWAERDLRAARGWFLAQPAADRPKLFDALGETWARLDPDGLHRWLSTRSEEERKPLRFSSELVRALSEFDPAAALTLSALYENKIANANILQTWARRDPLAAATKSLEMIDPGNQGYSLFSVMKEWVKTAPEDALAWLDTVTDPVLAERGRFSAATVLAETQGIAAADLVRARYPEVEQSKVLTQLAWGVAQKDPEAVVRWAQENAEPRLRQAMIQYALGVMCDHVTAAGANAWPPGANLARPDAKRLADLWLSEFPEESASKWVPTKVFGAIAEGAGLAEAVRFLERLPAHAALATEDALKELAKTRGLPAVAAEVFRLPPSEQRGEWLGKAVESLAKNGDVPAARALIERLPAPAREPLVRALAVGLLRDDPEGGAQMLLDLPQGRDGLQNELSQWMQRDPPNARRWVAATAFLTNEERQKLLTPRP